MFKRTPAIAISALILTGAASIGVTAYAATSGPANTQSTVTFPDYCVKFGTGPTAAGNTVEFNWNGQACPANSYPHALRVNDSDPFLAPGFTLDSSSVNPTRAETGIAFTITDFATNPATVYDCMYTVPKLVNGEYVPGNVCTKH